MSTSDQENFELKSANQILVVQRNRAMDAEVTALTQVYVDRAVIAKLNEKVASLESQIELLEK